MRAPAPRPGHILLLALAAALGACNVCGPDKRAVLTYADNGFTVARGSAPALPTTLNGSLYEQNAGGARFDDLWGVFARGAQPYPAVAVTLTGGSSDQMVGLVLALPTPVRSGQHLVVGAAFAPPSEPYVMYWSVWGRHAPAAAGQVELALRVSDFSPTGGPTNPFVASAASGTVDVAEVDGDTFRLQLDITATNATGEKVRLQGPAVVRAQRESATCFS